MPQLPAELFASFLDSFIICIVDSAAKIITADCIDLSPQNSKINVYQRMWDFMSSNEHVFVQSYREGIERVRNSKVGYHYTLCIYEGNAVL